MLRDHHYPGEPDKTYSAVTLMICELDIDGHFAAKDRCLKKFGCYLDTSLTPHPSNEGLYIRRLWLTGNRWRQATPQEIKMFDKLVALDAAVARRRKKPN